MPLSKEAIVHLEKTEMLSNLNKEFAEVKTRSSLIILPEGFKTENLERFMPNRDLYRFNFSTKSIKDFVKYCKDFDQDGAKCFVKSDDMTSETIFDIGTEESPLHQENKANLALDKTAAFKALLKINGQHLSQKDTADFVEDWADNIEVYSKSETLMTIKQASKQLREITIEQISKIDSKVDDFGESMSAMEKVEAQNQELIPSRIEFTCDPYHGLDKRVFVVRVAILTGGQKPELSLRIVRLEAQEEDIAEEFKEILVKNFISCSLKTFIGQCQ